MAHLKSALNSFLHYDADIHIGGWNYVDILYHLLNVNLIFYTLTVYLCLFLMNNSKFEKSCSDYFNVYNLGECEYS